MSLSPVELSTLSRLLEEALDLEPSQVEAWLASLPPEHGPLLARLREMLAEHLSDDRTPFLSGGPRLDVAPVDGSVAHAGDLVGPYRLINEIGSGGMGAVWLAERADGSLKRHIALKLPRLAWGAGLAERMARERDIGALLEHPHIARLYDAGVDALGRPYLAFEYIDGLALDAWCEAKALTVAERLRLFLQVVRAVAYAHGRLVVHRDLKPSNVLVTPDGQARLLDFGIAKLLQEGASGGDRLTQEQGRVFTPHFASPEQLRGEAITVASDVYSLGVLLYDLLTGQHPYAPERKSLGALEQAILEGEPALASSRVKDKRIARQLHGELDAIVAKALKPDPAQRYATADALAQDIERYLRGDTVSARPDSVWYRLGKIVRRHRLAIGAATAVFIAMLAGGTIALLQAQRAAQQAERTRMATEFVTELFKVNARPAVAASDASDARPLPAESALDQGARLIQARFAGQPDMQAQLYGAVGRIYADIGANKLAAEYANRELKLLDKLPEDRAQRIRALLLLADASWREEHGAQAETYANQAVELARPDEDLWPEAKLRLAFIQRDNYKEAEAHAIVREVEKHLQASGETPSVALALLLGMQARMKLRDVGLDEALPLYQLAIDTALKVEGPFSRIATGLRTNEAEELVARSRFDEARPVWDKAMLSMRSSGAPGEISAAVDEAWFGFFMFEHSGMTYADATRVIEQSRAFLAVQTSPLPPDLQAKVELYLALVEEGWGNLPEADRHVRASAPVVAASSDDLYTHAAVARTQGIVEMQLGRHKAADAHLRQAFEQVQQMPAFAKAPQYAYRWVEVAMNLIMQGDCKNAEQFLSAAPRFSADASDRVRGPEYARAIPLTVARARLACGDVKGAVDALPTLGEPGTAPGPNYPDRGVIGEILCAAGRPAEGLQLILSEIEATALHVGDIHPALARLRAVAGLCAVATGQRSLAKKLAMQAAHAFELQPEVSPYFKEPLERLSKLLSEK